MHLFVTHIDKNLQNLSYYTHFSYLILLQILTESIADVDADLIPSEPFCINSILQRNRQS